MCLKEIKMFWVYRSQCVPIVAAYIFHAFLWLRPTIVIPLAIKPKRNHFQLQIKSHLMHWHIDGIEQSVTRLKIPRLNIFSPTNGVVFYPLLIKEDSFLGSQRREVCFM